MIKSSLIRDCSKLLSFAKPYWKLLALAIASMIVYTAVSGIQISLIKPIIDKFLANETKNVASLPRIDINQTTQGSPNSFSVEHLKKQTLHKIQFLGKIKERATSSFNSIGIVMLILSPLIFLSAYFQQYLRSRVMWSVVVDIRNKVCDHLIPQPLILFENRKSGDLL